MARVLLSAMLLCALPAAAQDLMELLNKGPVVLVEVDGKGKFDKATAVTHIKVPPAEAWKAATDFANFKNVMPKLLKSDAKKVSETRWDVDFEIEVPGPNTYYTFRYELEPEKLTMKGNWAKGDIKGSYCIWRVVPHNGESLLYYTTASKNFSSLAQDLEDEQQTITVGVNVTAALSVAKAMKAHLEGGARAASK
ncbi:MAG: SRPBCC family protein [Myxococcales bacterium]|nr:SRPBCC family protein [Myxococcales bacterium]